MTLDRNIVGRSRGRFRPGTCECIELGILAIAFAIRLYRIERDSFWNDESSTMLFAQGILRHGVPVSPLNLTYWGQPVLHEYLTALAITALGPTVTAGRIISVVFGTGSVGLLYLFGKRLHGPFLGLAASAMEAFSLYAISWSRQARHYAELEFFFVLTAFLAYELIIARRPKRSATLFLISLGALVATDPGLALSLAAPIAALPLAARGFNIARRHLNYALGLAGMLIMVALFFGNDLSRIMLGASRNILIGTGYVASTAAELQYSSFYLDFLRERYPITILMTILGAGIAFAISPRKAMFLFLSFLIPFTIESTFLTTLTVRARAYERYIFPTIPMLFLISSHLVAFPMMRLRARFVRANVSKILSVLYVSLFIIMLLTASVAKCSASRQSYLEFAYHNRPEWSTVLGHAWSVVPNYQKVCEYLATRIQPSEVIVADTPDNTYYYLGRTDFWLTCSSGAIHYAGVFSNLTYVRSTNYQPDAATYDGSPVIWWYMTPSALISNVQLLIEVIKHHPRGWLVYSADNWRYQLSSELRDFVRRTMCLVEGGSDDTVYLYSWKAEAILFEDEVLADDRQTLFWKVAGYGAGSLGLALSDVTDIKIGGTDSMKAIVSHGAWQRNLLIHDFSLNADWSSYEYLSLWIYGGNSGLNWEVYILAPDNANRRQWRIPDTFLGWRRFTLPLGYSPLGNENAGSPNLATVGQLRIDLPSQKGTWYIDRIMLQGAVRLQECPSLVKTDDSLWGLSSIDESAIIAVDCSLNRE